MLHSFFPGLTLIPSQGLKFVAIGIFSLSFLVLSLVLYFFLIHLIREEADKESPTNVVFLGKMNKDYGKEKIIRLFEKSELLREYEDLFELS